MDVIKRYIGKDISCSHCVFSLKVWSVANNRSKFVRKLVTMLKVL